MGKNIIKEKIKEANQYPSWELTDRQICDLELLLTKGFNPLDGFLDKKNYESVVSKNRLFNGSLWPIPITLDISKKFSNTIKNKKKITLRDKEGFPLSILEINDIWEPDLKKEATLVYGTDDVNHPGVNYLYNISNSIYVGGKVELINYPRHYDYQKHRHTPKELKKVFNNYGWKKIIAFQTRNPLHKAHIEMTMRASKDYNAKILIHPVVGLTKPGDVDHYTRVRCYEHALDKYSDGEAFLSLIPLAMRMGGPREALWHAIIRKNYGCTHLIVGRDHAGPGNDINGQPFYGPYEAQELLLKHEKEIGIKMIPFKFMVYIPSEKSYEVLDNVKKGIDFQTISGTELRTLLDKGKGIPEWFTYPKIAKELENSRPTLLKRGLTIFFTGLSGSGKSTLANGLLVKFLEEGSRPVSLLDGDIVRTHLSSELGFSKEHRSLNVQRIGFVASEITKNRGIAICAPIAPYTKDRSFNRALISKVGGYIEIYVSTSLEKCEERDVKGLYQKARKGLIPEFTGISDPYEEPRNPEFIINSSEIPPEKLVNEIYSKIINLGYVKS